VLSDAEKRGFYDRTGFAPPETEVGGRHRAGCRW
jgi:hypothetical protein